MKIELKTRDGGWNPYIAGGLAGALAVISAFATTRLLGSTSYLGASTTFVRFAGFLQSLVAAERVELNEYFERTGVTVNWQFMLVIGIFFGALVSSLTDKSFRLEKVPPLWSEYVGTSIFKRALWAFTGGIVAMIGARMASGCPSGHGLSGTMQLSVSAFVALAMFFGCGLIVANLFYRKRTGKITINNGGGKG